MKIRKKELLILSNLRNDSRMSLTKLSKKTSIPISTIYDNLKEYKKDLILKNTSLLDFQKLGYNARAKILISVKSENKEALKEHLKKNNSVNNLFRINNGYDFMMECIFKSMTDIENFVENLDKKYQLEKKEIHYILDDIKRESFLSSPEYIKLLE